MNYDSRCRLGIISTTLLLLTACTPAPDPKLRPAQLWREGTPPTIEKRELLGNFKMEGDVCWLQLNEGKVMRQSHPTRGECYGTLFLSFHRPPPPPPPGVSFPPGWGSLQPGVYAWGDIKEEKPEGLISQPLKCPIDDDSTLDVNSSTKTQLLKLEGITSEIADAIIAGRPYRSGSRDRRPGVFVQEKLPKEVWEKHKSSFCMDGIIHMGH